MGAWAEVAEVLEVEEIEDADATGGFSHRRALVGAVDMIISLSQDQNYSPRRSKNNLQSDGSLSRPIVSKRYYFKNAHYNDNLIPVIF